MDARAPAARNSESQEIKPCVLKQTIMEDKHPSLERESDKIRKTLRIIWIKHRGENCLNCIKQTLGN